MCFPIFQNAQFFFGISQPCLMTPKGNAWFFFMGRPWSSSTLSALACLFSANWPRWTRIYTCDHVCICIHMYTIIIYIIYIYTCILLYDIHAWYTTFYIQSDNDNDTTLRTLLVFDSEPAVIAALQGKEVRCRRCQTCVPRCAFPSFSHFSRHSGSFQHIFDRDQCSMTVQWNTREPFDVKFIYI